MEIENKLDGTVVEINKNKVEHMIDPKPDDNPRMAVAKEEVPAHEDTDRAVNNLFGLTQFTDTEERRYSRLDLYELARLVRSFLLPYPFVQAVFLCPGAEQNRPYHLLFVVPNVPIDMKRAYIQFMGDLSFFPNMTLSLERVYRDSKPSSRTIRATDEWSWWSVIDARDIVNEGLMDFVLPDQLVRLYAAESVEQIARQSMTAAEPMTHSPDFRSIRKEGKLYSLTSKQAQVLGILWDASEEGTPEVGQGYILEQVSGFTSTRRLKEIFKKNSGAWNTLIERGTRKGTFRLKK